MASGAAFCALCGGPFDDNCNGHLFDPERSQYDHGCKWYDSGVLVREDMEWLGSHVLLLKVHPHHELPEDLFPVKSIHLTLPTKVWTWDFITTANLAVPHQHQQPPADQHPERISVPINVYHRTPSNLSSVDYYESPTFPMHEACYRMLEIHRGPPSHTPVNNERLYAYLLREFKKLTMSAYGLEYVRGLSSDWDVEEEVARFGGAERFWDDVWDEVRGYEYLVCDPLDLELRLPPPFPPPPPKEEENEQAKKSEETKDPLFATLPPEVILQVLTHLTLRELDNLRTASPVIARVRLSEEGFWRKRLEAMPWAWEIQEQEVVQKWGYEGACRALGAVEVDGRGNLADGSGVPLGVRNRVRIWRCLGSVIAGLDEEEVEDEEDEYDGY